MESERTLRQAGRGDEADRLYGSIPSRRLAMEYLVSDGQFVADRVFPIVPTDRPSGEARFERRPGWQPPAEAEQPFTVEHLSYSTRYVPIETARYTTQPEYITEGVTFAQIIGAEARRLATLVGGSTVHHELERNSDQQLYRCQACGYTADCVDTMTGHRLDGTCNWRIEHARYAGSDAERSGRTPQAQRPPVRAESPRPAKRPRRAPKHRGRSK